MAVAAMAVAAMAVAAMAVTSEVAEHILAVRILAALVWGISVALEWAGLGSVPLTSVTAISAACRAATSLTSTRIEQARPHWAPGPLGITVPGTTGIGITA